MGCSTTKEQYDRYKRLVDSRTLIFSSAVSSHMMSETLELLTFMERESTTDPIVAIINSPGGEAYSGLGLYDALRSIESPLKVIVNGLCASAGILLCLSGEHEDRVTFPHSRFMIHQPLGYASGQQSDIEIEKKEILALKKDYFTIIANRISKDFEEVVNNAKRDQWLSAEEALQYGLVSRIISKKSEFLS